MTVSTVMRHRRTWTGIGFITAIVAASVLGASIGLLESAAPVAMLVAAAGVVAMLVRPELATILFAFSLYLNLPDIAVTFHDVPFVVAAAFLLLPAIPIGARWIGGEPAVLHTPALAPLLAFTAVAILSAMLAVDLPTSIGWLTTFATEGLILYLLVTSAIRTEVELDRVVWAVLAAGAVMAGISVLQELTNSYGQHFGGLAQITSRGIVVDETAIGDVRQPRLGGPIGEQNRYAQVLIVLLPLAVYQLRRHGASALGLFATTAGGLILAGMTLTYSRGAMIGLAAIVGATVLLGYVRGKRLLILGVLVLVGLVAAGPTLVDRVATLAAVEDAFSPGGGSSDGSLQFRATVNIASWNVFVDHPVVGVGPGLFERRYSAPYGNATDLVSVPSESQRPAHNLLLGIAAELGALGLVAFVVAVGITVYRLLKLRREVAHPGRSDLATAFALSLMAYLITGVFLHLAYMRYFWFLLALANAAIFVLERQRAGGDPEEAAGISLSSTGR